ncbi:serine/threonine-protein kinase Sgk1-like isoform X2 [Biomphalaria pfeifferi]|uniref:Serine/threonine-protein kinase Sgk1-like isoform X2 n=1 Tax=Biomphalaria pfeifferi TaxID=112525 RepID=A0AAD8CBA9_BIOPF|nr:serine/threonine-protein kinase Sgk1-like isoform X2 [Biomphalaria pfeifferi]
MFLVLFGLLTTYNVLGTVPLRNMEYFVNELLQQKEITYLVYKVIVNCEGRSWFIFRRYNEFHSLYEKIKKLFPEANLKLPGKKIFGNLDPEFIQHRREGLDEFIRKLVTHPKLCQQ